SEPYVEDLDELMSYYVGDFIGGMAVIIQNGHGLIDRDGKFIAACMYDDAECFPNGVAKLKKNGKWGIINTSGEVIINFVFDHIEMISSRMMKTLFNKKYGILDISGKTVAPCIFDEIEQFSNGMSPVK